MYPHLIANKKHHAHDKRIVAPIFYFILYFKIEKGILKITCVYKPEIFEKSIFQGVPQYEIYSSYISFTFHPFKK